MSAEQTATPDAVAAVDSTLDGHSLEREYREVNGVRLHVVAAGDADAPLVVLLHGFPEFWYGWHRSIGPLAEAGYRVLVPDQRGYNRSDKPERLGCYRASELADDVAALVRDAGRQSAHIVGHDWGGAVAWNVALHHPAVVDRLGVLNLPHPEVFQESFPSNRRQLARSWYMFFAQLPKLPEAVLRSDRFDLLPGPHSADPGTFTEAELTHYRNAWKRERAATGMLNWYRALFRHPEELSRVHVEAPTLLIWGGAG